MLPGWLRWAEPEQEQKWQEVSSPTDQGFAAEPALAAAAVATPSAVDEVGRKMSPLPVLLHLTERVAQQWDRQSP